MAIVFAMPSIVVAEGVQWRARTEDRELNDGSDLGTQTGPIRTILDDRFGGGPL